MNVRRFVIWLSSFAVFGIVLLAVALGVTQSLVNVADDFFTELHRGDFQAAYAHLSREFHDNTSVSELRDFAQESALAHYEGATWWERSITGDEGFLDGEVETNTGRYIPVTMWLLKEGDDWKIYQIDWGEPQ